MDEGGGDGVCLVGSRNIIFGFCSVRTAELVRMAA